jgi:hypothetical protein
MAPHGNRRATVVTRVGFGTATLRPDPARAQGFELLVDGVSQSYVDLADPTFLEFEYVRRLGAVLRLAAPAAVPVRVLHLGGGGLTLARFVSATRPGSVQRLVDRDAELMSLVARLLPLPGPVEIVIGDARDILAAEAAAATGDTATGDTATGDTATGGPATAAGYDVIVADVFDGARMPGSVAAIGFAEAAARALRPGGLFAMNLTDLPPLAYSRIQVATLRAAFGDVCLIAGGAIFRGRKAGNVVLVAGHRSGDLPVRALALAVARDPVPARVVHGAYLDEFVAGAKPRLDAPG